MLQTQPNASINSRPKAKANLVWETQFTSPLPRPSGPCNHYLLYNIISTTHTKSAGTKQKKQQPQFGSVCVFLCYKLSAQNPLILCVLSFLLSMMFCALPVMMVDHRVIEDEKRGAPQNHAIACVSSVAVKCEIKQNLASRRNNTTAAALLRGTGKPFPRSTYLSQRLYSMMMTVSQVVMALMCMVRRFDVE